MRPTFEFNSAHASANNEDISLVDGAIRFKEVRFEVDIKKTSSETLNSVINRQDMNPLAIFDIGAGGNRNHITKPDPEVVSDHTVHANLLIGDCVIRQDNANGLFPLLALQQHSITLEELQLIHFLLQVVTG